MKDQTLRTITQAVEASKALNPIIIEPASMFFAKKDGEQHVQIMQIQYWPGFGDGIEEYMNEAFPLHYFVSEAEFTKEGFPKVSRTTVIQYMPRDLVLLHDLKETIEKASDNLLAVRQSLKVLLDFLKNANKINEAKIYQIGQQVYKVGASGDHFLVGSF